jgi:hypothetical protein
VGYVEWNLYSEDRWKKKLLRIVGKDKRYIGNMGGGCAVDHRGGVVLENDWVSERWRWGVGGGDSIGKQVDEGERDGTCGVNSDTVQSDIGSTRGYTCSGWLLECVRNDEVTCEICVTCKACVFCTMRVCAMELPFSREKGIVLIVRSGMAQCGVTDQSRWNINCGASNMCSCYNNSRDICRIRTPCAEVCCDECFSFNRITVVMCTADGFSALEFVMIYDEKLLLYSL